MEFSWIEEAISVLPKSFQSDAKCEAIDISLCTDAPSPPKKKKKKKKKNSGTPNFSYVRRGWSVHRLIDMILMQITLFCT